MSINIATDVPPIREDASGALRVGDSRVLLELVIRAFDDGETPEAIARRYTSVPLHDIYAVIAYYLRHREQIQEYLQQREKVAQEIQEKVDARQGHLSELRDRLEAHRKA